MSDVKDIEHDAERDTRADVKKAGKGIVADAEAIAKTIEAWFARHFNHVTPGTHEHTVLVQAKNDLQATLAPAAAVVATTTAPKA